MMRMIRLLLATGAILTPAFAQEPPPVINAAPPEPVPPAAATASEPAPPPRSEAELDQLLAPIALHSDPLLAQILPAATQPTDIVLAARYLEDKKDSANIDEQPWDPSVKALARFPTVIKLMSDDLSWTVALGNAFFEEPEAVMAAVQRLRLKAQAVGNLSETKEQKVIVETVEQQTVVKIVPADPQIIYVPQYNPQIVYVEKPREPGKALFTFFAGVAIGAWLANDFDWHHRGVVVLPGGWRPGWHRPVIGGNININIWRPRPIAGRPLPPAWTRPPRPGPGWGGVARPPAIRPPVARPPMASASPNWPGTAQRPNRPEPARPTLNQSRPVPQMPSRPAAQVSKPATKPASSIARPVPRPSVPTARPVPPSTRPTPGSAFGGYNSGARTRDFSNRGAQSRPSGGARGGKR